MQTPANNEPQTRKPPLWDGRGFLRPTGKFTVLSAEVKNNDGKCPIVDVAVRLEDEAGVVWDHRHLTFRSEMNKVISVPADFRATYRVRVKSGSFFASGTYDIEANGQEAALEALREHCAPRRIETELWSISRPVCASSTEIVIEKRD
jgi:hypothetical protein